MLGHLLFVIMMLDINKNTNRATLECFADDTWVWQIVSTGNQKKAFQHDLYAVYQWADIEFTSQTNDGMRFGDHRSASLLHPPNGESVKYKVVTKDLGVLISKDARLDPHIKDYATCLMGNNPAIFQCQLLKVI